MTYALGHDCLIGVWRQEMTAQVPLKDAPDGLTVGAEVGSGAECSKPASLSGTASQLQILRFRL